MRFNKLIERRKIICYNILYKEYGGNNMKTGNRIKKIIVIVLISVVILTAIVCAIIAISNKRITQQITSEIDKTWNTVATENAQPQYLKQLNELSKYTINSIDKEDSMYVIKVTVTAPDVESQLKNIDYAEVTGSETQIDEFLCEQVKMSQLVNTETYIYVYKTDDGYKVSFSDEFVNAMSGKMYTYSQNVYVDSIKE